MARQDGASDDRQSPGQVLLDLRNGVVAGAMPLLRDALESALKELDQTAATRPPSPALVEDRADIALLLRDALEYERRWQEHIDLALKGWPALPRADSGGFELMAESELQSQLIGASVIDALERRFEDPVELLDQRLYTLAANLGASERPRNPFAPRSLAECFLRAFTTLDASIRVHALVLKHFARLASDRLGAVYRWCNGVLAEAGYELSSGNEGVLVLGRRPDPAHWRQAEDPVAAGGTGIDAIRARLMRRHPRQDSVPAEGRRALTAEELRAILTLLQVEAEPSIPLREDAGTAERLRLRIQEAGAAIGIPRDSVARSALQEASIEMVGRLFDVLAEDATLSPRAARLFAQLALPVLRIALEHPALFDDPGHPLLQLLGQVLRIWDGNGDRGADERDMHRLADDAAAALIGDQQGDIRLAARLLERIQAHEAPLRRRADVAARRTWQSLQGKERLDAARREADDQLRLLYARGPLSSGLAAFLAGYWRHWLVQTWLREGRDSARFTDALRLGANLLAVDAETDGHRLAGALLRLEPALRDTVATSGLQGEAAMAAISTLVADFANPDRERRTHAVEALADQALPEPVAGAAGSRLFDVGDRFIRRLHDGTPQLLQLVWQSPLSGRLLLVDGQGAQAELTDPATLAAAVAAGRYRHRRGDDPVREALRRLAATLARDDVAR